MKTIKEIFNSDKLVLAPMAKVSNRAFRLQCKKFGAGLVYTEMVVIPQILHDSTYLENFFTAAEKDFPIAVQLIGNEKDKLKEAIDVLNSYRFFVDFNLGCPSQKFKNQEKGGFLLKRPEKIQKIMRILINNSDNPISAKIRTGFDTSNENAKEIALLLEREGIQFLCIHGRTVKQKYRPGINIKLMREVKQLISIPMIGNGDIKDGLSAKKMLNETGCDAIMIGRAAIGNPHIFHEITMYLKDETFISKDLDVTKEIISDYWKLYNENQGSDIKLNRLFALKQFSLHALRGFPQSKKWRINISKMKKADDILEYISKLT
ncbi:MAG: tRNA dihydrouridine synthase [Candidatus Helarchaeota archaeon]